ncbi:hypothetical protein KY312_02265, partial [Candidatus Woesearchaeota archaeon]|nr:hypothetical protein [Candidatus Woesearchaeota archaeon]
MRNKPNKGMLNLINRNRLPLAPSNPWMRNYKKEPREEKVEQKEANPAVKEKRIVKIETETKPQTTNEINNENLEEKVDISSKNINIVLPTPEQTLMFGRGEKVTSEMKHYFFADIVGDMEVKPALDELENCYLVTAGGIAGLCIILGGKSGGSKTVVMDKYFGFLPDFEPMCSGSKKGFIELLDDINQKGAIYIHEFQETVAENPLMVEALKHNAEGKDWHYERLGITYILGGHVLVGSTGADENSKMSKMNVELLSRFLQLETKDTKEKDKAIQKHQDAIAAGEKEPVYFSTDRLNRLKNYFKSIIQDKNTKFINPFAVPFGEEYMPLTQKSARYSGMYRKLITGFAMIDKP